MNANIEIVAECWTILGMAIDCPCFHGDRHELWSACWIYQTEYKRVRVGLVVLPAVPSNCRIAAKDESLARLEDCQRTRLVVAFGMKAFRLKAISGPSIEQLELLAAQIAQLDEVALHLVAVDYL